MVFSRQKKSRPETFSCAKKHLRYAFVDVENEKESASMWFLLNMERKNDYGGVGGSSGTDCSQAP